MNQRAARGAAAPVTSFSPGKSGRLADVDSRVAAAASIQNSVWSVRRSFRTSLLCSIVGGPRTSTRTPGSTLSRPERLPKWT